MGLEDLIKDSNVQRFGLFFWVMLSGITVLIVSIPHGFGYRYGGLGLILFIGGAAGYCISELMDRISAHIFKKVENGKTIIIPPLWFHILNILFKAIVFTAIFIVIQYYYGFFPPSAYMPKY